MPGGDGTGPCWAQGNWRCPRGMGAGMGRAGYGRMGGRGTGPGYGRRAGYARMQGGFAYAQAPSAKDEQASLTQYANELSEELEEVKKAIKGLEKK